MHRPRVKRRSALAQELMALIDASDATKLRWLVRKDLVDNDTVEPELCQHRDAGSP